MNNEEALRNTPHPFQPGYLRYGNITYPVPEPTMATHVQATGAYHLRVSCRRMENIRLLLNRTLADLTQAPSPPHIHIPPTPDDLHFKPPMRFYAET
jgi:hypothetical protein